MRRPTDRDVDPEALAALERAGVPEPPPHAAMPSLARHGRGATLNPPVRFDHQVASAFDDGWDTLTAEFGELPKLATYLGHVDVAHTYWYLEAVPELLQLATDRLGSHRLGDQQ